MARAVPVRRHRQGVTTSQKFPDSRVFKNKHQAVSQGVRRFGKRSPPAADEHLQKPHNAGSRPQAQFFNTLLCLRVRGRIREVMAVEALATTAADEGLAFVQPCAGDLKRPPALRAFQRQPRAHVLSIILWHLLSFPAGRNPRTGAGCSMSFCMTDSM